MSNLFFLFLCIPLIFAGIAAGLNYHDNEVIRNIVMVVAIGLPVLISVFNIGDNLAELARALRKLLISIEQLIFYFFKYIAIFLRGILFGYGCFIPFCLICAPVNSAVVGVIFGGEAIVLFWTSWLVVNIFGWLHLYKEIKMKFWTAYWIDAELRDYEYYYGKVSQEERKKIETIVMNTKNHMLGWFLVIFGISLICLYLW